MSFSKRESQKAFQSDQSVGRCLRPIMLALRVCGVQPFSLVDKSNTDRGLHYFWKWNSIWSLYSILLVSFLIGNLLLWMWSYIHLTFFSVSDSWFINNNQSRNGTFIERISIQLYPLMHPILCIMYLASSTINTIPTLQIIKNWNAFEIEYKSVFPTSEDIFKVELKRVRRIPATLGFLNLVVTSIVIGQVNHINCSPQANGYFLDAHICWLSVVFTVLSFILSSLEDAKQFTLLYALAAAFMQVRIGIAAEDQICFKKTNDKTMVSKLQSLITLIKSQAQLTTQSYSAQHVFYIFLLFMTLCVSLFMGILCMRDSKVGNDVLQQSTNLAIFLCFIGFCKLIGKVRIAERILSQEKLLINGIRMMKTTAWENDLSFELEISMLVDYMEMRPSKICFGGILTLSYILVLQMVGQVTTYLMVLAQFNAFK